MLVGALTCFCLQRSSQLSLDHPQKEETGAECSGQLQPHSQGLETEEGQDNHLHSKHMLAPSKHMLTPSKHMLPSIHMLNLSKHMLPSIHMLNPSKHMLNPSFSIST